MALLLKWSKAHKCNGCMFYDRENLSTHFKIICICNIVAGDFQEVMSAHSFKPWEHLLHVQDCTNADILSDSGFKLSDIIVVLCSKLLDYILLKSGSISLFYSGSKYQKCHVVKRLLHAYSLLYKETKDRFRISTSSQSFWYIICPGLVEGSRHKSTQHLSIYK